MDMRDKMSQRMREFEEESRKWRDQFISSPSGPTSIGGGGSGLIYFVSKIQKKKKSI